MKQKFEIGEEVIIQSIHVPEWNGPAVISNYDPRLILGWTYIGPAYQIEGQPDLNKWFFESSIKKKQQPGNLSFHDLMETFTVKEQL